MNLASGDGSDFGAGEATMNVANNGVSDSNELGAPNGQGHNQVVPPPLPPSIYNMPPMGLPVQTPGVTPDLFPSSLGLRRPDRVPSVGSGAMGIDRLSRILMSLKSDVQCEVDWALAALLEISFSSPDTFSKDRIKGEAILSLVSYHVRRHWPIIRPRSVVCESYEWLLRVQKILEALLILRNSSLDASTAQFLAPRCREIVERGLSITPALVQKWTALSEVRMLCLEIAEHICFHLTPYSPDSTLFSGLVNLLETEEHDRAVLVCSLRSLARLSVADQRDCIMSLSRHNLEKIYRFLLLGDDDSELVSACLDVLYQFTSRAQSISQLGEEQWIKDIISTHMVRLLAYKMEKGPTEYLRLPRRSKKPIPAEPPQIPTSLLNQLLGLNEPDRALSWIRASFEPDPEAEVTQVSLWNGYQKTFEPHARTGATKRLLRAIDYIRQASNAFPTAEAAVVTAPSGEKKFIIRGLRPREKAVNPKAVVPIVSSQKRRQPPPVFGPTAALVIQNLAKLRGGHEFLKPLVSKIAEAAAVNEDILPYLDGLLDLL